MVGDIRKHERWSLSLILRGCEGQRTLLMDCDTLHSTRAECIWKGYSERCGTLRGTGVIRIGLGRQ